MLLIRDKWDVVQFSYGFVRITVGHFLASVVVSIITKGKTAEMARVKAAFRFILRSGFNGLTGARVIITSRIARDLARRSIMKSYTSD